MGATQWLFLWVSIYSESAPGSWGCVAFAAAWRLLHLALSVALYIALGAARLLRLPGGCYMRLHIDALEIAWWRLHMALSDMLYV